MDWGGIFLHAIGHESTYGVIFLGVVVGGLGLLAFMASRAEKKKKR